MANHFVLLNYYNETVWALAETQQGTKVFSNDPIWGHVVLDLADVRAFAWYERYKPGVLGDLEVVLESVKGNSGEEK